MKKTFNRSIFFNWPAFVLSVMLCVAFIITTIAVSNIDYTYGTYVYEDEQEELEYEYIINLQEKQKCEIIQAYISDLSIKIIKKKCEYIVYKDKLYITELTEEALEEEKEYKYFGKIDGVRIYNIQINGDSVDLTSESGLSLKITCIVLVVIFAIFAVVNLLVVLIGQKEKQAVLEEQKTTEQNKEKTEGQ